MSEQPAEAGIVEDFDAGKLENDTKEKNEGEESPESAMDSLSPEEQAEKEVEVLGEQTERAERLSETIEGLEEENEKEQGEIKDTRENPPLSLPPQESVETSGSDALAMKKEKAEALNEKIEEKEAELLGLPEGEDFEGEQELEEYKAKLDEFLEEGDPEKEKTEEEIKKEREDFVDHFISDSIDDLLDFWKVYIDKYENKEKAINFIKRKTIVEVRKQAKGFIETGKDVESMGFSAGIKGAYFDNKKGERIEYLTDFDIEFVDGSKADAVENQEDEEDLLGEKGKKNVDKADEEGLLEEGEGRKNK